MPHKVTHKHFSELPEEVDFSSSNWSKNWGWGIHGNAEYVIEHVNSDGDLTIYKIPKCIGQMLDSRFESGKEELRSEFRKLIALD